MRTIIDSDRGPIYTLLCLAVSFGLIVGLGIIPIMYLFGWIAGLLFTLLIPYLWLDLAMIFALVVYYMGVFIAAAVGTVISGVVTEAVDSAFQAVTNTVNNVTSYIGGFFTSTPALV